MQHLVKRLILLLLGGTFVLAGLLLGWWLYQDVRSNRQMEQLRQSARFTLPPGAEWVAPQKKEDVSSALPQEAKIEDDDSDKQSHRTVLPQFRNLLQENTDLAGWLWIPGTNIDYPVMYRVDDNEFYLHHNFSGEEDVNGLLVLDKRCEDRGEGVNSLIHGHNMKSGLMFGSLENYVRPDYCREHADIIFSSLYEERRYKVFAVFRSTVYDKDTEDFGFFDYIQINTEDQFEDYVAGARANALYEIDMDVTWGDRLITLSTCEYSRKNGRLVVVGKEMHD